MSDTICQDAITGPGYICSTSCSMLLLSTVIYSSKHHYVNAKKKYGQFDFRHELALCLINNFSNCIRTLHTAPIYIGPNAPLEIVNHQNQHMNSKCVRTCVGHKRFEGKGKKTVYGCKACKIHLCKQCHLKWHNP